MNKKILSCVLAVLMTGSVLLSGCSVTVYPTLSSAPGSSESAVETTQKIPYSFATKEDGVKLLMSNTEYYDGFTQNDLDYKFQKKGAEMDEYLEFAKEQVLDFSDEERKVIEDAMTFIEDQIKENGYVLPRLDPIVFINTTQKEECGAAAYTHGTQIYLNAAYFAEADTDLVNEVMAHEVFHCLTRSTPEFRKDMYKIIHFTVQDEEYELPPSVKEYFINNPDVEHHNAYATFTIDGKKIDCFAALVTTKHFEKEGDSFFNCMTTALVPVDGSDIYYTPEDTSDFDDIFGTNTGYVIDPEECMADNFSYAITYGKEGPGGEGYANPEIIDSIIDYLKKDQGKGSEAASFTIDLDPVMETLDEYLGEQ